MAANNTGITLDTEFVSQIINLIFCKIYDERFTKPDDMVSFRAGINENISDISKRIIGIFEHVKAKYPDVFTASDIITLSDSSIAYIAGEIQQYCLIESERDVIADAFETFISPSLRGGQGQFFTPRNVVKLLVSLANPTRKDRLVDPACGSGGFLIESLRYVWSQIQNEEQELGWPEREIFADQQEVAIKNFRGIDKESFLSKTTKAYMAILGDGRGGIFCENSLDSMDKWSTKAQTMIAPESFNVVLTNPPYGSKLKIDDPSVLAQYELGHQWKIPKGGTTAAMTSKNLSDQTPQVLFIEIRVKQFTQDIIDTLGRRIMELELPIPKDKATQEQIITHIKEVFDKRNEAKELMRNVLLNVTPLHRFDDDSSFMTLV